MKVLVTGGAGSIGRHLVRRLSETGHDVRALVRPGADAKTVDAAGVEVVHGDIRDAAAIERATQGCTHVYHLAAITSRHRARRHEYEEVNVRGTGNVVRAAVRANVERLIYVGSAGIHAMNRGWSINEDDTPRPNSHYRQSKLAAEAVVNAYHRAHGLPAVIVRPSSVYGPGLLNWLGLFRAVAGGRFRIIGTGEKRRQLGYISDVVDGLVRCASAEGIIGQTYIITGSEAVTIEHLVQTIAEETSIRGPIRRLPDWPYRAHHRLCGIAFERFGIELPFAHRYSLFLEDQTFDISKARQELGYQPAVYLREGVRRTVAWYRANGHLS